MLGEIAELRAGVGFPMHLQGDPTVTIRWQRLAISLALADPYQMSSRLQTTLFLRLTWPS